MSELLGRIRVVWDGLAPRERLLVSIAGGSLVLVILLFGLILPVAGATANARTRAEDAERNLAIMQRTRREWDGLHDRLGTVEQRIQSARQSQNLLTLLEALAQQAGVKPTSMEKRQSGESERYEETKVEVALKNVTLQQAVDYLASIERADQPLSIKSLRIKRRPGRAGAGGEPALDLIDVTFSVSGFKPLS
ncbi:MAG: type II secretion system protein M [Spirochaetaceae bacterium]|nr:type II secretion system protein M [Myxococcales bacterium]MCB9722837.1 type II secretion system protein M [Spirochaetaceae bacterium]